jgi:hypothetical protein
MLAETPDTHFYQDVAAHLAEFAKIPPSDRLGFSHSIEILVSYWAAECGVGPAREARKFWKTLCNVKNTATTLKRQLEGVQDQLEQVRNASPHKMNLMISFKAASREHGVHIFNTKQSEIFAGAVSALSALTAELEEIASPTSGRPRGAEAYHFLAELVFDLEYTARLRGGRFTLNKRDRKGTIVESVNWLRSRCLAESSERTWLANFLPRRNQHPVAVYETALLEARHKARIEARRRRKITRKLKT